MKYPKEQFDVLKQTLNIFKEHFDLESVHPCSLHFLVFQQFSEGLKHNALWVNGESILNQHVLVTKDNQNKYKKLVDIEFDFLLYPNDCVDVNIEVAVKKAIREILTN